MKRLFTLSAFLLAVNFLSAQITLSTPSLDFGDVMTDAPQTLSFDVINGFATVDVDFEIVSYNQAFTVDVSDFTISGGGSQTVQVTFSPKHNIPHNSEIVVYVETGNDVGNLGLDILGRGIYPDAYYAPTQDLSEEPLKAALTALIDGHTSLGYSPARDEMYMEIDNHLVNGIGGTTQNKLITAYTGRVVEGYVDRSDAQTNDNVNTEHTFPQSTFSSNEPMRSDLFHIFVTDQTANSQRGNLPFGYVSSPTWSNGGSKKNSTHFEPRDVQKGPTSRAMLYFLLRYGNLSTYVSAADEDILIEWCDMYQPDTVEQRRNNAIFGFQSNRNPLIDHPEFTERITTFIATSTAPAEPLLVVTDTFASPDEVVNFELLLVANGNQDITISDLAVSDPAFSIVSAPAVVVAGESGVVEIDYTSTGSVSSGELTFTTNALNADSVTVDLMAGFAPTGIEAPAEIELSVIPNPVTDNFEIRTGTETGEMVYLYKEDGRLITKQQFTDPHRVVLDLEGYPAGTYIIRVETNAGIGRKRIIKM